MQKIPRGIRNNNPLNLRASHIAWRGEVDGSDPGFATFDNALDGIRAGCRVLLNYQRLHGDKTLAQIIARFAPPADGNDTSAYLAHVAQALGVSPDQPIDLHDPTILAALCRAIIRQEEGEQPYPPEIIAQAVAAALIP